MAYDLLDKQSSGRGFSNKLVVDKNPDPFNIIGHWALNNDHF